MPVWQFVGALFACVALVDGSVLHAQEGVGQVVQPLVNEQGGGVAERVFFDYTRSSERTLRNYATVTSRGDTFGMACSGTMIGPNVMLTAAHCRGDPKTVTFRAYFSASRQITESYNCEYLVHGWPETDIALFWCNANDGVNPGDRWGYVDLDIDVSTSGQLNALTSARRVRRGADVYSIWSNPIGTVDGQQHHIYSEGEITDTGIAGWYNPGGNLCNQDNDDDVGVRTDVWGAGGASGSSQLSSVTHRILLAPLSTASGQPDGAEGRNSAAVLTLLTRGELTEDSTTDRCADRTNPQVNGSLLQELWREGIRFDADIDAHRKYFGRLDKNRDGIFDVQHDLERSAGESARSFYRLSFESHRRNALWTRGPGTAIVVEPTSGYVRTNILGASDQWYRVLRHERLHLDPNRRYRVRYRAKSTGRAHLRLCSNDCYEHSLSAGDEEVVVHEITGGRSIDLLVRGDTILTILTIRDIAIAEIGAPITFDSHDERGAWRNQAGLGQRQAYIWPQGKNTPTQMDWAGIVRHQSAPVRSDDLVTDMLAIPGGRVRVCFNHRLVQGSGESAQGRVRLRGVSGSERGFRPGRAYTRTCTPWAEATTTDTSLQFTAEGAGTLIYAVDNITIERPGDFLRTFLPAVLPFLLEDGE